MSDSVYTAIVTAVLTGAVNWGILSTKLAWMRRDIDELKGRMDQLMMLHWSEKRKQLP